LSESLYSIRVGARFTFLAFRPNSTKPPSSQGGGGFRFCAPDWNSSFSA